MAFAIRRRTPPPLNGTNFHPFFTPFFSFAIESYILYETDLALYILLMLWLLTATYYVVYLAMFIVTSTTIRNTG